MWIELKDKLVSEALKVWEDYDTDEPLTCPELQVMNDFMGALKEARKTYNRQKRAAKKREKEMQEIRKWGARRF